MITNLFCISDIKTERLGKRAVNYMDNLKLLKRLNPSAIDISIVADKNTDLNDVTQAVKLAVEVNQSAGIIISNDSHGAEYANLCNHISERLIAARRPQCTPEWVYRSMIITYLGCVFVETTNVMTGAKYTTEELKNPADLSDSEFRQFIANVKNWAKSKKML